MCNNKWKRGIYLKNSLIIGLLFLLVLLITNPSMAAGSISVKPAYLWNGAVDLQYEYPISKSYSLYAGYFNLSLDGDYKDFDFDGTMYWLGVRSYSGKKMNGDYWMFGVRSMKASGKYLGERFVDEDLFGYDLGIGWQSVSKNGLVLDINTCYSVLNGNTVDLDGWTYNVRMGYGW